MHEPDAALTLQVRPPGEAVTTYDAGAPPEPAATVTVACASPATAVGAGGVPGAVSTGVTEFDGGEAMELPPPLVATVVNV